MTRSPALSVRGALAAVRRRTPERHRVVTEPMSAASVAGHFARRYAGVPANSHSRTEDVVVYSTVDRSPLRVLIGLYGDPDRVRGWLPGLPARANPDAVQRMLAGCLPPKAVTRPACQQRVRSRVDLTALPVPRATPRDAGPYLTTGIVYAEDGEDVALSVHRMLVIGRDRLTIWMVPGRQLRAMHERAIRRRARLPVSVNLGAPPAAMVASALNTRFLPPGVTKLDVAGALAGAPLAVAPALSQPTPVLAESEIVLEGFLDGTVADECAVGGAPGGAMPEFLGYDGAARTGLPVVSVTGMTTRRNPLLQAVIGPGREQSILLGLAGALSVALSGTGPAWRLVRDVHLPPAGGGMLLLAMRVRKDSAGADAELAGLARQIVTEHPFVKLVVAVDYDVDIRSAEDLWWAVTTRANLGVDCARFPGFRPLGMDPSQGADWAAVRGAAADGTAADGTAADGTDGDAERVLLDATVPYRLRDRVVRSF